MSEDEKDNDGLRALASAAQAAPDDSFEAASDFRANELIPDTEYTVRSRIGRGGHATVYECENNIGRIVAVKVIQRHLARRPELLVGMVDEARRQVRIRHPKIVEVYRAGVTSGARPIAYIEMERLVGGNGRQLLVSMKRVQVLHALDILIDVSDALAVAHAKGVVHQDLKPDNVFIHFDEHTGKAATKLLDFGVARIVGQAYNQFEGTLPYAPPEQLSGGDVSPLSDLYALGVVMFEFLTGRRPFEDAEDKDRQEEEQNRSSVSAPFCRNLVDAKMERVAPRVSDIAEDVHLPRELEDIIAALLERDSARRILPRDPRAPANENAEPTLATAADLAKRLRAIRSFPGLQKTTLTTQQLLVGALRDKAAEAGAVVRVQPAPVMPPQAAASRLPHESPGAPAPRASDGAPLRKSDPKWGVTLPLALPYQVPVAGVPPQPASGSPPQSEVAARDSSGASPLPRMPTPERPPGLLRSISPAVHTTPVPAPKIVQRSTARLDVGPPVTGAIVGTLDPVIERRTHPQGMEEADEPSGRPSRRFAILSVVVATPFVLALIIVGGLRLVRHPSGTAASLPSSSAVVGVEAPAPLGSGPAPAAIPVLAAPAPPPPATVASAADDVVSPTADPTALPPPPSAASSPTPAHSAHHGGKHTDAIGSMHTTMGEGAARPATSATGAPHPAAKPAPSASAHADWLEH
jgi:serine/threonine protein kinase